MAEHVPGERREAVRNALIESRLTPNAISITGLVLCLVSAGLVWKEMFVLGGIAYIVGSVCDTLDGRYSRMSGKGSPFGAFLDSTLDRIDLKSFCMVCWRQWRKLKRKVMDYCNSLGQVL